MCKLSQYLGLEYRIEQEQYKIGAADSVQAEKIAAEVEQLKQAVTKCIKEPELYDVYEPANTVTESEMPKLYKIITAHRVHANMPPYYPQEGYDGTPTVSPPDTPGGRSRSSSTRSTP